MQTAVWGAMLLIVHFLGILACGYWLMLRLLRARREEPFAVILPLCGTDSAAQRLYAQHLRLQLTGEDRQGNVIALDLGLSEQQREECVQFCRCTKNVYYCTPDKLAAMLEKIQKDT